MAGEKDIPMKVAKERTDLSARQIRYYDEEDLIFPERSEGNQRLFSEQDIARLKKIKKLLGEGYTISAVKKKLRAPDAVQSSKENRDKEFIFEDRIGGRKELKSLYPVSNRSSLMKILEKKKNNKEDKENE
ncbi:MAG: MerR family transcriptional regulator [Halanaerobiales bacterium]